jgi:hypothetical protein
MKNMKQILALFLSCSLLVAGTPRGFAYQADPSAAQPPAQAAQQTSDELQQLVAPIALYPDALVAQILAASTYPTQVVEADRWMQSHSNLRGEELAKEVDKQDWDPSVKAMTQFPSVLQNMDKNLSWASSLGEAYLNQPQDVTDAVQTLREQARKAGHLQSNEQENVATQGNTIIIEPTDPQVVYVPAYDPWVVYGALSLPTQAGIRCPEFFGEAWGSPSVSGLESVSSEDLGGAGATGDTTGMAVGHFSTVYAWVSHSRDFGHDGFHHGDFGHGNFGHGSFDRRGGFHGSSGFHSQPGTRSGAFSGFEHGGNVRGFSSRGRSSFHGGGHGGGGRH